MLLKSGIVLYRWFWQVSMSILCVVMHILCVYASDSVTRVNDSTRVTISGDLDSTRVIFRKMVTRLDWSHVFHRITRLESQSMTRDSSLCHFYKISWVPDGPTHFVCTQRNELFLLHWWSKLPQIFCFVCLFVLCCILRIKCPQLA